MSTAKDLKHERNRVALERVRQWAGDTSLQKQVQGLPVQVRSMGAAATVALLASRAETRLLAADLVHWLAERCPRQLLGARPHRAVGVREFLERWEALEDQRAVHALDEEALQFAEALKLFSSAWYEKEGR